MRQNDRILNLIARVALSVLQLLLKFEKKSRFLSAREGLTTTKKVVLRPLVRTVKRRSAKEGTRMAKRAFKPLELA